MAVNGFGDHDPEDEYDASDPPHIRLAVIVKIVQALDFERDLSRRARRRATVVRLLRNLAADVESG